MVAGGVEVGAADGVARGPLVGFADAPGFGVAVGEALGGNPFETDRLCPAGGDAGGREPPPDPPPQAASSSVNPHAPMRLPRPTFTLFHQERRGRWSDIRTTGSIVGVF